MSEKKAKEARQKVETEAIKEAMAKPTVVNSLSINLMSDGTCNVSGPIKDPKVVAGLVGEAFLQLILYYQSEGIKREKSGLILPMH
ncbi:MAG TPA: hypothetical protein ENH07_10370 [Nitrospirae bacterium]|nr:hypothetical protein [Nitrospirota bacterium]